MMTKELLNYMEALFGLFPMHTKYHALIGLAIEAYRCGKITRNKLYEIVRAAGLFEEQIDNFIRSDSEICGGMEPLYPGEE